MAHLRPVGLVSLAVGGLFVSGCRTRGFNARSAVHEAVVARPAPRPSWAFSYHNGADGAAYMAGSLASAAGNAALDESSESLYDGNNMGFGVYLAADPFSSMTYGNRLECLVVKEGTAFAQSPAFNLEAIHSTIPLLRYTYLSVWFQAQGGAAVARAPIFDAALSRSIPLGAFGPLRELGEAGTARAEEALNRKDACGVLEAFSGQKSLLFLAGVATYSQASLALTVAALNQASPSLPDALALFPPKTLEVLARRLPMSDAEIPLAEQYLELFHELAAFAYFRTVGEHPLPQTPVAKLTELLKGMGILEENESHASYDALGDALNAGLARRLSAAAVPFEAERKLMAGLRDLLKGGEFTSW